MATRPFRNGGLAALLMAMAVGAFPGEAAHAAPDCTVDFHRHRPRR